ncbi:hypothetical protein EP331_06000 [bacterium]|nr:MAG: hypothetical protein EP331_06000 [bacterium]
MRCKFVIKSWFVLGFTSIFLVFDTKAQAVTPQQLMVYQSASQEVKSLLDSLLEFDPVLDQFRSKYQRQLAMVKSKDALPNPELGVNWTPVPMQKALNQTVAFRAMQAFPWPGTISSSVALQEQQAQIEYWSFIQKTNERMTQYLSFLIELERVQKQQELVELQLNWIETLKADIGTRLSIENVRKTMLEIEIEESLLKQKDLEWMQSEQIIFAELTALYPAKQFPKPAEMMPLDRTATTWSHPVLEAAKIKQRMGKTRHQLASSEGKPRIALGAEYMWIQEAMPIAAPEMQMQPAFMLMASISLPVYRKKFDGLKGEAKQSQQEGGFEFDAVQKGLTAKLETLKKQHELKTKELELFQKTIPQKLMEMSALEKENWETGKGSLSSWIQIERRLLEQKSAAINSEIALKKIELEIHSITAWEEKP